MGFSREREAEKEAAARRGVELVRDGMVVGLGTGSTAALAIRMIGERIGREGLGVRGIPTSRRSEELAGEVGIPLTTFADIERVDLVLDGADEVDPALRLIKGGGGALLHEKIVAAAADQVVIIADSTKPVPVLGRFPLPVEVIPFGWQVVARRIADLGGSPSLRMAGDAPFRTDEQNHILDCRFGTIPEPEELAPRLKAIPGVVEHGLFIGLATVVLVGRNGEVETLGK